jgi:hypothetical protein
VPAVSADETRSFDGSGRTADAVAAIEQAMKAAGNLGADALADANNAWWSVSTWQERRLIGLRRQPAVPGHQHAPGATSPLTARQQSSRTRQPQTRRVISPRP